MKDFKKALPHPNLLSNKNLNDPNLAEMKCLGCGSKTAWEALNKAI